MNSRPPESRSGRDGDVHASGDPPFDSRPLAAYHLGRNCFGLWMWHKVFWAMPEYKQTWNGIPLSVEQLRRARLVLADVIRPNIFNELPRVLGELNQLAATLTAAWCRGDDSGGFVFGSRTVPGGDLWDELRILIGRSLDRDHPLRSSFELGLAIGKYLLSLSDYGSTSVRPSEDGELPDILPLVRAAIELPDYVLSGIPRLETLVFYCRPFQDQDRRIDLGDFFRRHPDASKSYRVGNQLNVFLLRGFVDSIDSEIESALVSMRELNTPPKPDWNAGNDRCLRFNGAVVKHVKRRGSDIEQVLNAFQAAGWPEFILNPFRDDPNLTDEKPHDLVRSLNKNIQKIKFHVEGGGRRISWGPASRR